MFVYGFLFGFAGHAFLFFNDRIGGVVVKVTGKIWGGYSNSYVLASFFSTSFLLLIPVFLIFTIAVLTLYNRFNFKTACYSVLGYILGFSLATLLFLFMMWNGLLHLI